MPAQDTGKVGPFSKIDCTVSRYGLRSTQAQETNNYPGDLEHKERRSPFPTINVKCQHALNEQCTPRIPKYSYRK